MHFFMIFMPIYSEEITLETKARDEIIDITEEVQEIVKKSKLKNGIANVWVIGSTASITTIEYESGLIKDMQNALNKLFPKNANYEHNARWGDDNGYSHIRASFLKSGITVPFVNGNLVLGTWQQIVFLELDNKKRQRRIFVQIIGE